MPSLLVWIFWGSMRLGFARGGWTCEGFGPFGAGSRRRRISLESSSDSTSEISPSDGSLSRSLSLTSSIRACDIMFAFFVLWRREGEVSWSWWGRLDGGVEIVKLDVEILTCGQIEGAHVMWKGLKRRKRN